MTGKHHNWHRLVPVAKRAPETPHQRRRIRRPRGDGFNDINAAPETLGEFQSFELARGVPVHVAQRLIRQRARPASGWHMGKNDLLSSLDALVVLMGQTTSKKRRRPAWCWWEALQRRSGPARRHHDAGANQAVAAVPSGWSSWRRWWGGES